MKRKVKYRKGRFGHDFIKYKDKVIDMEVFRDGSGHIEIKDIDFFSTEGTHKSRIKELERFVSKANTALKILEQIENPEIYFPEST